MLPASHLRRAQQRWCHLKSSSGDKFGVHDRLGNACKSNQFVLKSDASINLKRMLAGHDPTLVAPLAVYIYPARDIDLFAVCADRVAALAKTSLVGESPWANRSLLASSIDAVEGSYANRDKHNADYFFSRALAAPGVFVSEAPDRAKLFVIPGMCTQSFYGRCGGHGQHQRNVAQLARYLNASRWFRRHRGRDHFLLCDRVWAPEARTCTCTRTRT